MKKKSNTARYTATELTAMRRTGVSRTNWQKLDAMSETELAASIAADPDDVHEDLDWTQAVKGIPERKLAIKLRIDAGIVRWFRASGKGYQTRMNNVLRAYVDSREKAEN